jgi:translation initiation factor 3 subunit G
MGRKWADVDEDDEEEEGPINQSGQSGTRFETPPDKDGVKTVIEYIEKNGQTYKVTRRVKVTVVTHRTSHAAAGRKSMAKFGKPAQNDPAAEKQNTVRSVEEIPIELSKKPGIQQLGTKDDAEDKFLEESITITENLFKEKKLWSSMNKERQEDRDATSTPAPGDDAKPADVNAPVETPTLGGGKAGAPGRYVPPSLRGKGADGKGGGGKDGKGGDQNQEASLRITNLSEDVKEGDLQDLFGQCGRLQRVYLAKDMTTFQSKGFAFITYYSREDALRAIDKLNGHGYDNLILQVSFAKPRA